MLAELAGLLQCDGQAVLVAEVQEATNELEASLDYLNEARSGNMCRAFRTNRTCKHIPTRHGGDRVSANPFQHIVIAADRYR